MNGSLITSTSFTDNEEHEVKLMKGENKLLIIRAAENVIRLLPPLNVKKVNIDEAIVILRKVCKTY